MKKSELSKRLESDKEFLKEFENYYLTHTQKEILEKYNCSQTQLIRYINKYNFKKKSEVYQESINYSKAFRERLSLESNLLGELKEYYITHSLLETAKYFNCGRHALMNILKENGIKIHSYSYLLEARKDENIRDEIINYYKNHTMTATAKKFNCSRKHLKSFLLEFNVKIHSEEQINELRKDHFLNTYGVENPFQVEIFKNKIKQTNLERYGVENAGQSPAANEKKKRTNLERYGSPEIMSTNYFKEKSKETLINLYGCLHVPSYKYKYNNLSFDSFPELCFYLYHIKNNIEIKREPVELTYFFDNKKYLYYPDFEVNGQLIELKGEQFLTEDYK